MSFLNAFFACPNAGRAGLYVFFSSLCLSNFLAIAPSAIDMERRRRLTALTRVGWERELHLIWGGQVSSVITEETKKKKPTETQPAFQENHI